ncbi:MAG: hypothetical protein IPI52_01325 [Bacteroidetes bacterium]|nr:hypothetical protein [Bacteroidota bacterium]
MTAEERQKVADMVKYLDLWSTANISAVGHTDNTGDRANNIKLGQGRADFCQAISCKEWNS